jgi:hypothetical protein
VQQDSQIVNPFRPWLCESKGAKKESSDTQGKTGNKSYLLKKR